MWSEDIDFELDFATLVFDLSTMLEKGRLQHRELDLLQGYAVPFYVCGYM